MNGLIYRKTKDTLFIAVSDGAILVKDVYSEDGKDLFSKIKPGHRFVTPIDILDNAISFRARYDAKGLNLNKLHGKKRDK